MHAWCTWKPEAGVAVPGMEVYVVMSHHVRAGNWTWVLCKNDKPSYQLSHLSSSCFHVCAMCVSDCVVWCMCVCSICSTYLVCEYVWEYVCMVWVWCVCGVSGMYVVCVVYEFVRQYVCVVWVWCVSVYVACVMWHVCVVCMCGVCVSVCAAEDNCGSWFSLSNTSTWILTVCQNLKYRNVSTDCSFRKKMAARNCYPRCVWTLWHALVLCHDGPSC